MAEAIDSACQTLLKIVTKFTSDQFLREDLMQECLVRMWMLNREQPGQTPSWYFQNCRYHIQHVLASGRSLDSIKRSSGGNRVSIDELAEELSSYGYHTNGEMTEEICARDIVAVLSDHLRPCENAVLDGLADGLPLSEICVKLKISYPTTLKCRRKIASLTVKLGIAQPASETEATSRSGKRSNS